MTSETPAENRGSSGEPGPQTPAPGAETERSGHPPLTHDGLEQVRDSNC